MIVSATTDGGQAVASGTGPLGAVVGECRNPNRHPPRPHLSSTTRPPSADVRQSLVHSHFRRALIPHAGAACTQAVVCRTMIWSRACPWGRMFENRAFQGPARHDRQGRLGTGQDIWELGKSHSRRGRLGVLLPRRNVLRLTGSVRQRRRTFTPMVSPQGGLSERSARPTRLPRTEKELVGWRIYGVGTAMTANGYSHPRSSKLARSKSRYRRRSDGFKWRRGATAVEELKPESSGGDCEHFGATKTTDRVTGRAAAPRRSAR